MGWEHHRIIAEYRRYAGAKARVLDEKFIELFDERSMLWMARNQGFTPTIEPINDSPAILGSLPGGVVPSTRLRG